DIDVCNFFSGRPRLSEPSRNRMELAVRYEKFGKSTGECHFFDSADLIAHLLLNATKQDLDRMNYSAASCGEPKKLMMIYPKGVTPRCFYWGSSPARSLIPAKSMRE